MLEEHTETLATAMPPLKNARRKKDDEDIMDHELGGANSFRYGGTHEYIKMSEAVLIVPRILVPEAGLWSVFF